MTHHITINNTYAYLLYPTLTGFMVENPQEVGRKLF